MKKAGFTLVELLVVMAILGILASIGFGQYRTSQEKARDAQRKADLDNIARALEMYYNDNQSYPSADLLSWGNPFQKEVGGSTIIYMKQLPQDPGGVDYCYFSDGSSYRLYSILENERDSDYYEAGYVVDGCEGTYYYGKASTNANL